MNDGQRFDGFDDAIEIGRGGFGVVYRASDVALNRPVAIKLLATTLQRSDYERFQREGLAMSALSGHPNVVPVYGTGVTAEGRPYLIMQYLARGSLRRSVASGALDWTEAVRIGVRVSGALESAHRLGILHRDIKPDNILMSDFDEPMLADFGIARLAGAFETATKNVTTSVIYAAPEILDGEMPTVAADIYALGATLYHLLTGNPAFAAGDDQALVALYLRISREPVPELGPFGIPAVVGGVIRRAMSKQPADRQVSAEQFGRELQQAEHEAHVAVTPMALHKPGADARVVAAQPIGTNAIAPSDDASGSVRRSWTGRTITAENRRDTVTPSPHLHRRRVVGLASGVAVVVVFVVIWIGAHSSTSPSSTGTTQGAGSIVDIVDATPSGIPLTLGDTPVDVPVHLTAGGAVDVRLTADAGQRVLGKVTMAAHARKPIPLALLFNNSPIESNDITDLNVDIGPVELNSTGTWVLQIGPASDAVDGIAELGLAPPDVQVDVVVGGTAGVDLSRPRQRAFIHFSGLSGQRVVAGWTWTGADPLSTSFDLLAPDGSTVITSWGALGTGRSQSVTLSATGSYTIRATIDGDGIGSGIVAVTSAK